MYTGSENDSPAMFKEDQLYIVLVLTHGGYDLEAHLFTNAEQSHSILVQVLSFYILYFASLWL
jgi:serine/threonine-protein kinase haspin